MSWQQIVMIIWFALNIIVLIALDGKERTARKIKAAPAIIEYILIILVLYSGGFWS